MSETDPETMTVTVTCRTADCANAGAAIDLEVPADVGGYACGVCGEPIEDVMTR